FSSVNYANLLFWDVHTGVRTPNARGSPSPKRTTTDVLRTRRSNNARPSSGHPRCPRTTNLSSRPHPGPAFTQQTDPVTAQKSTPCTVNIWTPANGSPTTSSRSPPQTSPDSPGSPAPRSPTGAAATTTSPPPPAAPPPAPCSRSHRSAPGSNNRTRAQRSPPKYGCGTPCAVTTPEAPWPDWPTWPNTSSTTPFVDSATKPPRWPAPWPRRPHPNR